MHHGVYVLVSHKIRLLSDPPAMLHPVVVSLRCISFSFCSTRHCNCRRAWKSRGSLVVAPNTPVPVPPCTSGGSPLPSSPFPCRRNTFGKYCINNRRRNMYWIVGGPIGTFGTHPSCLCSHDLQHSMYCQIYICRKSSCRFGPCHFFEYTTNLSQS